MRLNFKTVFMVLAVLHIQYILHFKLDSETGYLDYDYHSFFILLRCSTTIIIVFSFSLGVLEQTNSVAFSPHANHTD
jgi:hypothetical protein